jgi:hypothetical protein
MPRVAMLLVLATAFAATAQTETEPESTAELQVEAAFLVNFVRYSDWPPQRFDGPASPYVVTVLGSQEATAALGAVAAAAGDIQGRRIVVRRLDFPRDAGMAQRGAATARLRDSHLVFIHHSANAAPRDVLRLLAGAPVLTVSDVPGFAANGGMLGLVRSGRRLAFEANPAAIQAANLAVSAKVLKLARIRGRAP